MYKAIVNHELKLVKVTFGLDNWNNYNQFCIEVEDDVTNKYNGALQLDDSTRKTYICPPFISVPVA